MSAPVPEGAAHGAERPPLLVVSSYYPPHVGGVEVCATRYAQGLAARGWSVQVITSAVGAQPGASHDGLARVLRLRALDVLHSPLMPGLAAALWRLTPGRAVHLHCGQITTDVVAALVARARRVPLVVHHHMDLPPSSPVGAVALPLYKRFVLGPLLRSAALVVTLTDSQRRMLQDRYALADDQVVTVANGVDGEYLDVLRGDAPPGATRDAGGSGPALRVLAVTRLAPQKNLALLVDAIPLSRSRLDVVLAGAGQQAGVLARRAARLGVEVSMPGFLRGEALLAAHAYADVFVVTSHAEGMPLALLGAMAAGLPVVVTDTPELRELVGEAGILLPEPTPAALAAALDHLAEHPEERERLGRAAREVARTATWGARADALDAALTTALVPARDAPAAGR